MNIKNRKPQATRFGTESREARLAHLRERAPTLGSTRRLRVYALFGSALLVLTVAALYLTLQIYKAASEERAETLLIEVDRAPEIDEREIDRTLRRIESEEAARGRELAEELEALKEVDLLGLTGESLSGSPQSSSGEEDEDGLEQTDDEADDGTE
jgi:hypothetical protein